MICELVSSTHKVLREAVPPFDFQNPPTDPIELAKNIADTMIGKQGLGLAAPQIGLPYHAFSILTNPVLVMFNAKIVDCSIERVELEEGCLSFPDMFLKLTRPREIRVRYQLPNGEVNTSKFADLTARIVQHELDHLNGVLFLDNVSKFHLDRAKKNQKLRQRQRKRGQIK